MANIHLKRFEVNSFKGIDSSKPVILDFTKKNGKNITLLKGNQGAGKSSTIEALMYALGAQFSFDADNFINTKDGTIKQNLEFDATEESGDTVSYRVNVTKSRFLLERFYKETNKWIKEDEPKTVLRKLVGHLGTSPMPLKERSGKEQIDWFRKTFGDEGLSDAEEKLKKQLKDTAKTRYDANKEYVRIKNVLNSDELYLNWEESAERFSKPISAETVKQNLAAAREKATQYDRAVDESNRIDEGIIQSKRNIDYLRKQIEEEEERLKNLQTRKGEATKYLSDNAFVKQEYQQAEQEFLNISQTVAEQERWKSIQQQKKEMDEFETLVQRADATKQQIIEKMRKLTKKYLPDIPGLKIQLNTGIDDDNAEGIIYSGKTLAQLSESELWDLYMKICEEKGINFVFIENVSSLGTNAIETLNYLADNGVKVFASEMSRSQNTMKILITDSIK